MLKVALVGVGGISGAHIPAWESREDAELVAICDIRPERMEKYPQKDIIPILMRCSKRKRYGIYNAGKKDFAYCKRKGKAGYIGKSLLRSYNPRNLRLNSSASPRYYRDLQR